MRRLAPLSFLVVPLVLAACGGGGSIHAPAPKKPAELSPTKTNPQASAKLQSQLRGAKGSSHITRVVVAGTTATLTTDLRPTNQDRATARSLCGDAVRSPLADSAQVFGVKRNLLASC